MLHRVFAARYLKRLLGRHSLLAGEPKALLDIAEKPMQLTKAEAALLTEAAKWGEPNIDMDVIALSFRAVASNYTREYLWRVGEILSGRIAAKGPDRKLREVRNQHRDMMEVIWQ